MGTLPDISPAIIRALQLNGVSDQAKNAVRELLAIVEKQSDTANRGHFYDGLDEWSKPIYAYIRERMVSHGFVNGEKNQPADARYWLTMFELFSQVTFSKYLKTDRVRHQASAYERNEAFKAELQDWVKHIDLRPGLVKMTWPGWDA